MQGCFRLRFLLLLGTFHGNQSNTQPIKIIQNTLFCQAFPSYAKEITILLSFWHTKTLQTIFQNDTNRYPFINPFLDRFVPDIGLILGAIWEAFKPLLAPKTRGLSGVVAVLLLTPISCNLKSFLKHQP